MILLGCVLRTNKETGSAVTEKGCLCRFLRAFDTNGRGKGVVVLKGVFKWAPPTGSCSDASCAPKEKKKKSKGAIQEWLLTIVEVPNNILCSKPMAVGKVYYFFFKGRV